MDTTTHMIPKHVAVIMDGNGRWAKKRNLPRILGHKNGLRAVRETIEASIELGIPYLTLYALSTENLNRPQTEVKQLMNLLSESIKKELNKLNKQNIRLLTIGDISIFPTPIQKQLEEAKHITQKNRSLTLTLALNYSGHWDISRACAKIAHDFKNGELKEQDFNQKLIQKYLTTASHPSLDFLIRTGGELRISNFLLWEAAYTELFFTELFWPDFRKKHFIDAIENFENRNRRFGKL